MRLATIRAIVIWSRPNFCVPTSVVALPKNGASKAGTPTHEDKGAAHRIRSSPSPQTQALGNSTVGDVGEQPRHGSWRKPRCCHAKATDRGTLISSG